MGFEPLIEKTSRAADPASAREPADAQSGASQHSMHAPSAPAFETPGRDVHGADERNAPSAAVPRAAMLKQVQRSHGNRFVQRMVGAEDTKSDQPNGKERDDEPRASLADEGDGHTLDPHTRGFMESRFGRDLAAVRIHDDEKAASATKTLSAEAFASGRDLYFAPGRYAPDTREGRRLLAHELAHSVQQAEESPPGMASTKRTDAVVSGSAGDPLEREADRVADNMMAGTPRVDVREHAGTAGSTGVQMKRAPAATTSPTAKPKTNTATTSSAPKGAATSSESKSETLASIAAKQPRGTQRAATTKHAGPVHAAHAPHGPPTFESETAEPPTEHKQEEPADEPFVFEPVEPLTFTPLRMVFGGAPVLAPDALRLPPTTEQSAEASAERDRNALQAAREAYAAAAAESGRKHDSLLETGNGAASGIHDDYTTAAQRIPIVFQDASDSLDRDVDRARSDVDTAWMSAEGILAAAWKNARRTIFGTASGGRARLTAAAKAAGEQIPKIIDEIFEPFKQTVTESQTACSTKGEAAKTSINDWRTSLESDMPKGDPLADARAEKMRKLAPKMIDAEAKMVATAVADTADGYKKLGTDTHEQIDKGARPPLDKHKAAIEKEGREAVDKAMRQALKQVNEQARDARKSLREMRDNAIAQLNAQRRGGRARLKSMGQGAAQALRSEANAALGALQNGVRSSVPVYERTVTRMGDTLKRAAEQGGAPLANAAQTSPVDVAKTLTLARRQQGDNIDANRIKAKGGLDRREDDYRNELQAEAISTQTALHDVVSGVDAAMNDAATKQGAAFAQAATAIASTTESWAKPITTVFPNYAKNAIEHGKASHTTWETSVHKGRDGFVAYANARIPAGKLFMPRLEPEGNQVITDLNGRVGTIRRELDSIFNITESVLSGALHSLTPTQGKALEHIYSHAPFGGDLRKMLELKYIQNMLSEEDYKSGIAYLNGNPVEGAKWEMKASVHWYNDEEERIEKIQRDLTPDQRLELEKTAPDVVADTRDALGGTDLNVFDALQKGNDARADAYRMRDKIADARRSGDNDEFNKVLAEYSKNRDEAGRLDPALEERRLAVQREFAGILDNVAADAPPATISQEEAQKKLMDFALQDVQVYRGEGGGDDGSGIETLRVEGAQRDLAIALVQKGEGSVDARTARLGVEFQRSGKPQMLNLDTALVDERLNPNRPGFNPKDADDARKERQEIFQKFADKYAPADASRGGALAEQKTAQTFRDAFKDDPLSGDIAARLVREEHPSPETAAMEMRLAIRGVGTNEDLAYRTVGRMSREEIEKMRGHYKDQTGCDMYADLGVFGHKKDWFNEFSGDEALQLEVKLLGIPKNDQERAEVAFLQAQQQMEETGWLGKTLAGGSMADADLANANKHLQEVTGGSVTFDDEGHPRWTGGKLFDANGNVKDPAKKRELDSAMQFTQIAAQNYAAKIDSFANAATMGIAILGAIVAAVVTVVTAGAASPLLIAAIAGITGLAGMAAHAAISGGRYGWEQAAVDLGMTAVQALTAGVGQSLGLASRGGAAAMKAGLQGFKSVPSAMLGNAGRLTGTAFTDMVLIGGATGGLNALGQTALTEKTWEKGWDKAFDNLLEGLVRGVVAGAATAAVSQAFEAIPVSKATAGLPRATIGSKMGESSNVALRGGLKAVSSGLGGFTGKGVELGLEKAGGHYKGDAGDIFQASLEAGGHSFVQGLGEGGAEAGAHAYHLASQAKAAQAQRTGAALEETTSTAARTTTTESDLPMPQRTAAPAIEAPTVARGPVVTAEPGAPTIAPRAPAPGELPARTALPGEPSAPTPGSKPLTPSEASAPLRAPEAVDAPARGATPGVEGAAARIVGSEMQLADRPVIVNERAALARALPEVAAAVALKGAAIDVADGKTSVRAELTQADGTKIRVRIEVGETEGTNVADFRRGGPNDNADFVVTLSSRAQPEVHARALAHELAELRFHDIPAHADNVDALRAGNVPKEGARLSAHDHGRLAELAVLSRQLEAARAPGGASDQVPRLLREVETLAGHLGVLHSDSADPRMKLAHAALGEDAPALRELDAARQRANKPGAGDALQPARGIDATTELSAADRRQIGQLEDLVAQLRRARVESKQEEVFKITRAIEDRVARMGLLDTDGATEQRLRLAQSALEPDSPVPQALADVRARLGSRGDNDALRPGLVPDASTVLSPRDLARVTELHDALARLADAKQRGASDIEIARAQHDAEAHAAALGLVHGENAAKARTELARGTLPEGSPLSALLDNVRDTALSNPLLRPRTGTLEDLPLLAQQIGKARAMGDERLAAELTQIAGFRIQESGALHADPALQDQGRRAIDSVVGADPVLRAFANEVTQRQAARTTAAQLRSEAEGVRIDLESVRRRLGEATLEGALESGRARAKLGRSAAALQLEADALSQRLQTLETAAGRSERIAFRPQGTTVEAAVAAHPDDPSFANAPRLRSDPDYAGNATQQRLVRQLYGDSPQFQSWERFRELYFDSNPTVRLNDPNDLARVFSYWRQGGYVNEATGRTLTLGDLPRISAGEGAHVPFVESATGQAVRLPGEADVTVRDRTLTVAAAESERRQMIVDRAADEARFNASTDATERSTLRDSINLQTARINEMSEGLGVAAGRSFAETLPGGGQNLTEAHGAGVPDLIHEDPATGRLAVIECKGGTSELGERRATVGGRTVLAEQTTPEYLRSLAETMMRPGSPDEMQVLGAKILAALKSTPPTIDVFVVRQPFDAAGNRQAVEVTRYDVTRSGE